MTRWRTHRTALRSSNGAAAVEFAIVVSVLLLILLGMVDFGRLFFVREALAASSREGARVSSVQGDVAAAAKGSSGTAAASMSMSGTPLSVSTVGDCAKGATETTTTTSALFNWVTPVAMFAGATDGQTLQSSTTMQCERAGDKPSSGGTGGGTTTAPGFSASPASMDFGTVDLRSTSPSQTTTITNTGTADLTISSATITGDGANRFTVVSNTCGTLVAGAKCAVTITFTPTDLGVANATISFNDTAAGSPHQVSLTGTGAAACTAGSGLTPSPTSLDFGSVRDGQTSTPKTVTFTNGDCGDVASGNVKINGSDRRQFVIGADTCTKTFLARGEACAVTLTFQPTSTGTKTAELPFRGKTGTDPVVALTGKGTSSSGGDNGGGDGDGDEN